MLVVSVGVNAWFTMPKMYEHAPWAGVHLVDLVFPTFIALSGCGLGYAYARRVPLGPTARRFAVLLIAGLAYNAMVQLLVTQSLDWSTLRWTGVLQVYAAVVLLLAVLHVVLRRWWGWVLFMVVLSATHVVMMRMAAQQCPDATLTPSCNPLFRADLTLFGASHVYGSGVAGHDPEGLFSLVGILLTASVGFAVATALGSRAPGSATSREALLPVARAIVVVVAAGALAWMTGLWEIPMKRLWTAPFGLGTASVVMAVVIVLAVLLDHRYLHRTLTVITYPLVALGRNSLLVYFGSHMIMLAMLMSYPRGSKSSWAKTIAQHVGGPEFSLVPFVVGAIVIWTLVAVFLHYRKIYMRP